jgi:ribokinase
VWSSFAQAQQSYLPQLCHSPPAPDAARKTASAGEHSHCAQMWFGARLLLLLLACHTTGAWSVSHTLKTQLDPPTRRPGLLVVGSVNVDIFIEVERIPTRGETVLARSPSITTALGGKGANQAVAAARLVTETGVEFVGRFGNDQHALMLQEVLLENQVDVSRCKHSAELPSGQGIVMLEQSGDVSAVVVGGANTAWDAQEEDREDEDEFAALLDGVGMVLLQREVPEHVNIAVAAAAAAAGVAVIHDMGGENRYVYV